jgi:hypothetical protein
MTFDKFRKDFFEFLENSTVNLGRKTAKTRQEFISKANDMFDTFASASQPTAEPAAKPKKTKKGEKDKITIENMSDRVLCIKPTDRRKALDGGKGVTTMTASESQRADEQLNRSPYTNKSDGGE